MPAHNLKAAKPSLTARPLPDAAGPAPPMPRRARPPSSDRLDFPRASARAPRRRVPPFAASARL
ncbi:hypothetical protein GCM10010245_09420 [Streptomyces spectabilis]|nr:hypothetical protein GCM10010245_09420 [Streptomyces spectabilis]